MHFIYIIFLLNIISFIKYEINQWINKYLPISELLCVKKYTMKGEIEPYIIKYFPIEIKALTDNQCLFWMSLTLSKEKHRVNIGDFAPNLPPLAYVHPHWHHWS